jgi:hypothetical protein
MFFHLFIPANQERGQGVCGHSDTATIGHIRAPFTAWIATARSIQPRVAGAPSFHFKIQCPILGPSMLSFRAIGPRKPNRLFVATRVSARIFVHVIDPLMTIDASFPEEKLCSG